jgi:hypothetical protein
MNYNPYAAPQPAPQGGPQGPGLAAGQPQPWEIGEVYTRAWEIYKANWGVLTGALVVLGLCSFVPAWGVSFGLIASGNGPGSGLYTGVSFGTNLLVLTVYSFLMIGYIRILLTAARGGTPEFATLFSGGPKFLPFLGLTLLTGIASWIGLIFLVVPGIIIGLGLWAAPYFFVDADLGVVESMTASWNAMRGQKLNVFLFGLVGGFIMLGGMIACCVGVLAAAPVYFVGVVIVFLRISGRGVAALPPVGYGGGPPPGYGGPPPAGGGYGGPPPGYGPPPGGYGGPPGGAPPAGGGYGGPPPGGYGPPGGGGGYGPAGGGPAR